MQRPFISGLIVIALLFVSTVTLAQAVCIDWKKLAAIRDIEHQPAGKTIFIAKLTNQTGIPEDDWLEQGLRELLADYLKTSANLRILSGLAEEAGLAEKYQYSVSGLFQHAAGFLRVFLEVNDPQGNLQKQVSFAFPYPNHKAFFEKTEEAAREIQTAVGVSRNTEASAAIREATSATKCYENYAKGRALLERYELATMNQTIKYFEGAKKEDYRSILGYQGLVSAKTWKGLMQKQERQPFAATFQDAEQGLQEMAKLVKPAPLLPEIRKKPKPTDKVELLVPLSDRILQGHALFLQSLTAAQKKEWANAARMMEQSLALVPEDAIGWWHLASMKEQLGKTSEANKARTKALEINPCLAKEGT
ncbi:MAG: hypothetical protein HY540_04590 [Deltaproteobacteria bacterium]|nr:hypothetical protein [Deltaproteobacteria bacterium]